MAESFKTCSVAGCNGDMTFKTGSRRGMCSPHYRRWKRYGDPLVVKKRMAPRGAPMQFLRDVAFNYDGDDCLIWPFGCDASGYGQIRLDGRPQYVSRVVCEHEHGAPNCPRLQAAHSCGNGDKGCCNPRHLRWATSGENVADTVAHGRTIRGEQSHHAKITRADVLAIRAARGSASQSEIAARYGITATNVCVIQKRRSWAWLK